MVSLLWSAPPVPFAATQITAGVGSVFASVTSGIALGGAVVGILAGVATVVTLVIFAALTVKKGRRDYENEIRAAEQRGEERQKEWTEYWKAIATGTIHLPPPPEG